MDKTKHIISILNESILLSEMMMNDVQMIEEIIEIANMCIESIKHGGRIYIFGNGGSASDALHMAGELLGRFQKDRSAYAAIALNADIASLTAIANDYGYENIFSRQLEGLLSNDDIVIGISTSGNSKNVYNGLKTAQDRGVPTIALLGKDGGEIAKMIDCSIIVPSSNTARIQENHIMVIHILCDLIEETLCSEV